jgi:transposase-like protein
MDNGSMALQSSNQSKSFSPKQRVAIEFIALNPSSTRKEVASHVGVTDTTVYDWQKDPYFVEAV